MRTIAGHAMNICAQRMSNNLSYVLFEGYFKKK